MNISNEYLNRRNELIKKMKDNSILILFGGTPKTSSEDEDYPFEINRNFYYLTGIEQENSILIIEKRIGELKETLYISDYNPLLEKWTGKRLTIEEAKNISLINNVLYNHQFDIDVDLLCSNDVFLTIYFDKSKFYDIKKNFNIDGYINDFKIKYPNLKIKDIYSEIIKLRMIKSEYEIECFKDAINNTKNGIMYLLDNIKENENEYFLSSLFYHSIHSYNHSELSFPTISAAGKNATCLHYTTSYDKLNKGDLILFDLGSRSNYYCADISRTFPIGNKFNTLQKKIYSIVLNANKLVIEKACPGVTIKELNNLVTEFMAEECLKHKLISSKEDIKKVYFHSVSHFIGLDTHDPAFDEFDLEKRYSEIPLKEGNVISDEPGLYFEELGIGVRIEDDLLITSNGCINLSKDIIKEIEDIEKYKGENL